MQNGDGSGLRGSASRLAGRTDTLLSAAFLRRLDATLDVKAKEVLSGADRLADGTLHLQLKEGRLDLDPAVVNLPGGTLRLSMAYDVKGSEVDFDLAARVERFDYGIIARRLRRTDDLRGLFSLNLEMAGTAPSLDAIMRNASGRIDFAVWPTELRSGVFNLWSANLILTLLPLIDPGGKSQVNCIVGRFDLKDGDLSDDKIMIDTSTVRIRGTGNANLATEKLAFVFRPQAKGIGLLRLQTPLRVGGTLSDQRFYVTEGDVFESVLRLIATPVLLPIEWLTRARCRATVPTCAPTRCARSPRDGPALLRHGLALDHHVEHVHVSRRVGRHLLALVAVDAQHVAHAGGVGVAVDAAVEGAPLARRFDAQALRIEAAIAHLQA